MLPHDELYAHCAKCGNLTRLKDATVTAIPFKYLCYDCNVKAQRKKDAETASMEELEAAEEILERAKR
jgi:hypothetical protein